MQINIENLDFSLPMEASVAIDVLVAFFCDRRVEFYI